MCLQAADGPASQIRKSAVTPAVPVLQSVASGPAYQRRINTCKAELQQLVQQKREQCSAERMAKQMMESAEWESRPPPPGNKLRDTHTITPIYHYTHNIYTQHKHTQSHVHSLFYLSCCFYSHSGFSSHLFGCFI